MRLLWRTSTTSEPTAGEPTAAALTNSAMSRLGSSLLLILTTACTAGVGAANANPDEPATASTTTFVSSATTNATTIPAIQEEGKLTVETPLGSWQWVRDDEGQLGEGLLDEPAWVELPAPPLPAIQELVWPQLDPELQGNRWGPLGGIPVSSGEMTITPALLNGHIDWSSFYSNDDGVVESRWRPLDGDCPWVEVCDVQAAALEIVAIREKQVIGVGEAPGGATGYREDGVLDVLVASIVPGDPDAVEFRDEDTSDLIVRLEATEGVSAQQLVRAGGACNRQDTLCGSGMYLWELYVDGVGWVEPPWHGLDLLSWPGVTVGLRDDGFWVVGTEGSRVSPTLHVWGSSDGVDWEEIAAPFPLGDSLPNGFQVDLVDGELVILTSHSNPDQAPIPPKVFGLVGGELTEVAVDLPRLGDREIQEFASTPWGWMATTWAGTCGIWVSADGTSWEEVTTPDGADVGDTVPVFTHEISDDGSYLTAENPVPTPAEDVPAVVGGSYCSLADDGSVYLEFNHQIDGVGTVWGGENYPNFFVTSWVGELVGGDQ